tara:strand:+ start:173 stop:505 length:333 start_codon:yes stop_codon:yes gene_type:complete
MTKETSNKEGQSPKDAYGTQGDEAMKQFKKKWEKWTTDQKVDTLLNMVLGVAYRLDILATVVDGIPDVAKMKQASKDLIEREKTAADALKGTKTRPSENKAKEFAEKHKG